MDELNTQIKSFTITSKNLSEFLTKINSLICEHGTFKLKELFKQFKMVELKELNQYKHMRYTLEMFKYDFDQRPEKLMIQIDQMVQMYYWTIIQDIVEQAQKVQRTTQVLIKDPTQASSRAKLRIDQTRWLMFDEITIQFKPFESSYKPLYHNQKAEFYTMFQYNIEINGPCFIYYSS